MREGGELARKVEGEAPSMTKKKKKTKEPVERLVSLILIAKVR